MFKTKFFLFNMKKKDIFILVSYVYFLRTLIYCYVCVRQNDATKEQTQIPYPDINIVDRLSI